MEESLSPLAMEMVTDTGPSLADDDIEDDNEVEQDEAEEEGSQLVFVCDVIVIVVPLTVGPVSSMPDEEEVEAIKDDDETLLPFFINSFWAAAADPLVVTPVEELIETKLSTDG